jgi:hypothetical protein
MRSLSIPSSADGFTRNAIAVAVKPGESTGLEMKPGFLAADHFPAPGLRAALKCLGGIDALVA